MERFTIDLPDNKKGEVRCSNMIKVEFSQFYTGGFESLISESEPAKTFVALKYAVIVYNGENNTEYCLFKSANGEWFKDYERKTQLDDGFLLLLKNAIIKRENEINNH